MSNHYMIKLTVSLLLTSFLLHTADSNQTTMSDEHVSASNTSSSVASCPAFDSSGTMGCMESVLSGDCAHSQSIVAAQEDTILEVPGIGRIQVKENTFRQPSCISLVSGSSEAVQALFEETASIFRVLDSAQTEYRIGLVGNHYPKKDLQVTLQVPAKLHARVSGSRAIMVFAGIEQASDQELPFVVFEPVDSLFDATASQVSFNLPYWAFSRNSLTNGKLEAIIVVGLTPN